MAQQSLHKAPAPQIIKTINTHTIAGISNEQVRGRIPNEDVGIIPDPIGMLNDSINLESSTSLETTQNDTLTLESFAKGIIKDLGDNLDSHFNRGSYKCPGRGCRRRFKTKIGFQNHYFIKHLGDGSLYMETKLRVGNKRRITATVMCSTCGMSFTDRRVALDHSINMCKNAVECHLCHKYYLNQKALDDHILYSHAKPIECEICHKMMPPRYKAKHDNWFHAQTEYLNCEICNKSVRPSSLYGHMLGHREDKVKCGECGLQFNSNTLLRLHRESQHRLDLSFECSDCNAVFTTRSAMYNHRRVHKYNPVECLICNEIFQNQLHLKTHCDHNHDLNNEPQKCIFCSKIFKCLTKYTAHINEHRGIKPYKCDLCGDEFHGKDLMKNHRKGHADRFRFVCLQCGKAFSQQTALKIHTRYHTGERPYECATCNKKLVCITALRNHILRMHPKDGSGKNITSRGENIQIEPDVFEIDEDFSGEEESDDEQKNDDEATLNE